MTALRKFQKEPVSHLRVVKSAKKEKTRSTEVMISNAWLFAQASLWDKEVFTETEIRKFRKLIGEFFEEHEYSKETFIEFCERVILAKRYVARSSFRYLPAPINWLNIHFRYGISGTAKWFQAVEKQRITAPEYNRGLSIMADNVIRYTTHPSIEVYRTCRRRLIQLKQFDLVPVFNSLVTAFHYLNN